MTLHTPCSAQLTRIGLAIVLRAATGEASVFCPMRDDCVSSCDDSRRLPCLPGESGAVRMPEVAGGFGRELFDSLDEALG